MAPRWNVTTGCPSLQHHLGTLGKLRLQRLSCCGCRQDEVLLLMWDPVVFWCFESASCVQRGSGSSMPMGLWVGAAVSALQRGEGAEVTPRRIYSL